jgi:FkbM family methyltransferase
MDRGRADSAAFVSNYFHELVDLVGPRLFVEAGAYRADASRRVRANHPECRVVAFEANPYNHAEYVSRLDFAGQGIDYLNLALTDRPGPVVFHLRRRVEGQDLRPLTGNSSILKRTAPNTEYEEVVVPGTTLDMYFDDPSETPVALWVDVEGATGQVLGGGRELLSRTALLLVEVEEKFQWEAQWRSLDVFEHLLAAGFVPVTRDAEYGQQYNVIFVRDEVYERPEILASLELHTNYLTQHMGVAPSLSSTAVPDSPHTGGRSSPWRWMRRVDRS